jgi:RsiW-degrading membrane proteinase PrsW (M82 family)
MIITCPLWAIVGNRWDLKWVLVAGTLGYTPYFAALYCNSVNDTQWFLILGAVTCGISVCLCVSRNHIWHGNANVLVHRLLLSGCQKLLLQLDIQNPNVVEFLVSIFAYLEHCRL